jgi:plastocyanin
LKIAGLLPSVWLVAASAGAATLEVEVTDREGQPVPDVAVTAEAPGTRPQPGARTQAAMDQLDQQFVPEVLVVQTGTPVVFPNSDAVAHQVYSFSPAKRFALGLYRGHPYPPVVFDQPGVVVLGCNIHDQMVGYILVTDTPWFGTTDARGRLSLRGIPSGEVRVRVWHPRFASEESGLEQSLTMSEATPNAMPIHLTRAMRPPPPKGTGTRVRDY